MKKNIAVFIIFMMTFTGLMACSNSTDNQEQGEGPKNLEKVTVILDWTPNTNHTGIYTAIEKGYYEEEGMEIEVIQSSDGGSADLIAAKQGDFGISYQEEVTYARTASNPLPVRAIAAIIQDNTSGFASLSEKNILSPKDFEGKSYGGWGSPMEEATLKAMMEKEEANFEKLEMVITGELDFFNSIENHVDFQWIFYGWDGIAAELNNYDLNFILLQDVHKDLNYYTPVIIGHDNILETNPELAKRFLNATSKGYQYAIDNPEDAAEDLLKSAPELDRDMVIASQKYLADKYQANAKKWGEMKREIWENYGNWMYEQELLEGELDIDSAFTNEFLPR